MDKDQYREVTRENTINKELIETSIYPKFDIKIDVSDEDLKIDLDNKKIYIRSKMTYLSFMTYMYIKWYQEDKLSRQRIPLKLMSTDIEVNNGWKIINKNKIFHPSDIKKLNQDQVIKDRIGELNKHNT